MKATIKEGNSSIATKSFKGLLILNWKTGSMRVLKTLKKKKDIGPWEVPVNIDIKINLPQMPEIIAKGEVDIPEYKVKEMFVESI